MTTMIKNLLILVGCIFIAALSWGGYYIFGNYIISIFLTVVLVVVLVGPVKSRFSSKSKPGK